MRDPRSNPPTVAPLAGRPVAGGPWGGFLLAHGSAGAIHVKLTGVLSRASLDQLDLAVRRACRSDATTFVLLDASALAHIPLSVAAELLDRERAWRQIAAVTVWVRPSPYLVALLNLACGTEGLPVLPDFQSAQRALRAVAGQTSGTARGRLEAWSAPVH
jgi:anti-anti-sigma regulatory factor